jgi:hypothetical protein
MVWVLRWQKRKDKEDVKNCPDFFELSSIKKLKKKDINRIKYYNE